MLIQVEHPLLKTNLSILRHKNTKVNEFRLGVKRITNILLCEATKQLTIKTTKLETPLAKTVGFKLNSKIVAIPILRAGLGMVDAVAELIPNVTIGHLGMYRSENHKDIISYYEKLPKQLNDAVVLLLDPMLATGGTADVAITKIAKLKPKKLLFLTLVAAPEGVDRILKKHKDIIIYTASLDTKLNDNGYIIPGLGDAGDRLFGTE